MREYSIPGIDIDKYIWRIELHAHTNPASSCSRISPERLVEVYSALKYDAVVLTNHMKKSDIGGNDTAGAAERYIHDFHRAFEAAKKHNIKVFLGAEVLFSDSNKEYLMYGIRENDIQFIYDHINMAYSDFAASEERKKFLIFHAHPLRNSMVTIDYPILDGIETFNMHMHVNSEFGLTTRGAYVNNMLTIGGSDYHDEGEEGMCGILTRELPEGSVHLKNILRSGDYLMEVNRNIIIPSHIMKGQVENYG